MSSTIGLAASMAIEKPRFWASATIAVFMPTTWPAAFTSGPPELPGLMAASVWMRPWRLTPCAVRSRSLAETMPRVTVGWPPRLSALPMAMTSSPTCRSSDEPSSAGIRSLTPSTCTTAMSSSGELPTRVAGCLVPSDRTTVISPRPPTTWALVSTRPSALRMIPEPAADSSPRAVVSFVSIDTTEGCTLARIAPMSRLPLLVVTGVTEAPLVRTVADRRRGRR